MNPLATPPASRRLALALALLAGAPLAAQACSSCGCTLNSDWPTQGLSAARGLGVDLRHDFFNQNDLRHGSGRVDRSTITFPTDTEVQQQTVNRNTTLTLDYGLTADWGVSVMLPWIDRFHTTIVDGDTDISTSRSSSLGDARVLARYTGFSPDRQWGLQFGLKLPTGDSTKVQFSAGPQAGEMLDRGLQPGNGATELLLGAFRFGSLGDSLDWFAHGLAQLPVQSATAFKPGVGVNASLGLRYIAAGSLMPQLQLNLRHEDKESGADADVDNSGATLLYLSPGLSWQASETLRVYGFAQVPLWQNVRGTQIEPKFSLSVGVSTRF